MVISRSISERVQTESNPESGTYYGILDENAGNTIWATGPQIRPTYISPSITGLLGYGAEDSMTKAAIDVLTQPSYVAAMSALARDLAFEGTEQKVPLRSGTLNLELVGRDDSTVPVEVRYTYLPEANESPLEILVIAPDETWKQDSKEQARYNMEKLLQVMESTIQAMAMIIEMKDPSTAGHQRRVAELACAIAKESGFTDNQVTGLRLSGLIHDIGKVRVPTEILTHRSGLSKDEFNIIKAHPALGYEILKPIDFPWPIAEAVHQHHERLDGSGYPLGLSGNDIISEARILAVADVVEAMASHRPYRPALGIDVALTEISEKKGKIYDPDAVEACLKIFREHGFRFN